MSKRIKLKKFVSGTINKVLKINYVSGSINEDIIFISNEDNDSENYSSTEVITGNELYDERSYKREYSVSHPYISNNPVNIDSTPIQTDFIDIEQFGNYVFSLSDMTNTENISYEIHNISDNNIDENVIVRYLSGALYADTVKFSGYNDKINGIYNVFNSGSFSGYVSGIPHNHLLETSLNELFIKGTIPCANILFSNGFALKNFYDYNYNTQSENESLIGLRDYQKIGYNNNNMWLSYNYETRDSSSIEGYQNVEKIKGFYKLRAVEGHKSNIYSIKIKNSGLNSNLDTVQDIQSSLQNLVSKTLYEVMKKISPTYTQLWKVTFEGR